VLVVYVSINLRGEYAAGNPLALKRRLINNIATNSKVSVICNFITNNNYISYL
jgi:hypothetical protein